MPNKNLRKAKGKKRSNRRKPKMGGQLTNVNRSLQPFPSRYICKMKYATTAISTVDGQYVFRLNSLYDPDLTGTGHQPYGYDNLTLLYNRYRVLGCGWRIQSLVPPTGTPRILGAIPTNDASILWNMTDMRENPRSKVVNLMPGANAPTLKGYISINNLVGRTKAQYMADDHYQAVVTTNPIEQALLYVLVTDQLENPAGSIAFQVILEYTVEFFDVKHVVQS